MIIETIQALQTLHLTIPDVLFAPTKYPSTLNSNQMVAVLVFPLTGITEPLTSKALQRKTTRIFSVRVFVEPVGQNTYDAPTQKSMQMLDLFLEAYLNNKELDEGYMTIARVRDSGIISGGEMAAMAGLVFGDNYYRGFVCNLDIIGVMA